jgi:membrane associated rhomboid family serine protease
VNYLEQMPHFPYIKLASEANGLLSVLFIGACPAQQRRNVFDPSPSAKTEQAFNIPWPVLGLCGFILGLYALQLSAPDQDVLLSAFALNPATVSDGNWASLFTYMCLHGSWLHAGMNAAWCLVFATPVARAFGSGTAGVLSLVGFYILCGLVGGMGFVVMRLNENVQMIGASGAIAGLTGAALRLRYKGMLLPLTDKLVLSLTAVFLLLNFGSDLLNFLPGRQASPVAWQTHVFGYVCGLLLIKPWVQAFHRHTITQI